MASSSKPAGVHYALVVFVLISIVCGLRWLLAYKGANSIGELERRVRDESKRAEEATRLTRALQENINRIKDLLNSRFAEVGDESTSNTVLWDIKQHIKTYGEGGAETYNEILVRLAELKRNATLARDKLQEQLESERTEFQQRVEELNARLGVEKTARELANRDKIAADVAHQESLTKRDADIVELRDAIAAARQHATEEREAAEETIKNLDRRIAGLKAVNDRLTAELDQKTSPNFERANGEVRWVDHVAKRVWVSLGKADGLKPQTTFSVYQKSRSGVGHGTEKGQFGAKDLKGAIEITRIVKSDLSEARIVGENIYKPISKGDSIYSPLWSSARGEAFSLVGIMDVDGDGKDDRDLLLAQIHTAGAVVDNDVDDKGILRVKGVVSGDGKPRMTEKTKFVVIGKLPEILKTADAGEMATTQKVLGLRKDLEDAARERGVHVISLSNFLNYIGYVPQRRLVVPGSNARGQPKSKSADAPGGKRSPAPSTEKTQKPKNAAGAKVFRQ